MSEPTPNPLTISHVPGQDGSSLPVVEAETTDLNPQQLPRTVDGSPAAATVPDLPLSRESWTFGRYEVQRLLGKGGMGEVYLAQDTLLQREVALKISRFSAEQSVQRERFLREARTAASLAHPNICPVHDVGEVEGQAYLTMTYVAGSSLAATLQTQGRFAPRAAAELVREIAHAMQHAHERGILHRDLKPANILLNEEGEPIVMDFGLAFRFDSMTSERLTEEGLVVGTPAYMPPEQINGQALGPTSDVYSLGVVLYELLTGTLPFTGPLGQVLGQIATVAPAAPRQLHPDLDPALEAICLKALAKSPQQRQASMAALAQALNDFLQGTPRAADAPPATEILKLPSRHRRWPLAVAGCLVAILTTVFILYWPEQSPPAPDPGPAPAPLVVAPPAPVLPDPKKASIDRLFAHMARPIIKLEAIATPATSLHLSRAQVPKSLLKGHDGPLYFMLSGSGLGHVIDLTDQPGGGLQVQNFGAGEVTTLGGYMHFLAQVGEATQFFITGGPAFSLLAPLSGGPGSRHVEFAGTHVLLPRTVSPTITSSEVSPAERAGLRQPHLTRKMVLRYPSGTAYIIYTQPDLQVLPGDIEARRIAFPEIHSLIELERDRQFRARTITWQMWQKAQEQR